MGKAIAITRLDLTAADLRAAATQTKNASAARRMLCLALVLEGSDRTTAAEACGMDRQTLRDWVHRYNDEGVAGLRSRSSPGRPAALNDEQMEGLRIMVLEGPDPERLQVIRWRCADLRDEIATRWSVTLHERSVGRLLLGST